DARVVEGIREGVPVNLGFADLGVLRAEQSGEAAGGDEIPVPVVDRVAPVDQLNVAAGPDCPGRVGGRASEIEASRPDPDDVGGTAAGRAGPRATLAGRAGWGLADQRAGGRPDGDPPDGLGVRVPGRGGAGCGRA